MLSRPEIRQTVAARFDAVFVDEYQDISGVQEALLNSIKRSSGETPAQAWPKPPGEPAQKQGAAARRAQSDGGETPLGNSAFQSVSDGQAAQRFFYVGDVKQSIYRFRQADPTLFMEKERTFSDAETAEHRRIDLNRNYRSRG
ncbi:MAG: UvrD-helicase domain-containing protein, partial [Firmicutes bacterium]|nr:UvrD-helicase domain-containing protein [Bacillota bacterium]